MNIRYLGHSSFALTGKNAKIVTDPFDSKMVGISYPSVTADVVTVSHDHPDHNATSAVGGDPVVLRIPGEYERKGARIYGYSSYHDDAKGLERGKNVIFKYVVDGVVLLHVGDLGHLPDDALLEKLKDADILFVPVGGIYTIDKEMAKSLVTMIAPSIVVPMHYFDPKFTEQFSTLGTKEDFAQVLGIPVRNETLLTVTMDTLPEEREVVVLTR